MGNYNFVYTNISDFYVNDPGGNIRRHNGLLDGFYVKKKKKHLHLSETAMWYVD